MYYTNNVFAENCGIIGSIPPHPQGAWFPLTNIMKLQPALKAIRKNPNLLLQRKGVVYYVDQTPRSCNDKPKSVSIYHGEGASSWEHGFAWASSKDSKELSVGYQDLMSNDWELLDGENILVSHVLAWEFPRSYVEKYDSDNKYQPSKSAYGQKLLKQVNDVLHSISSPCELVFKEGSYGMSDFHLESPENTDQQWRFKSTKVMFEVTAQLMGEEALMTAKKLFEDNRPNGTITICKVSMQEFIDRVQKSKKLWFLDALNSWKVNRQGHAVGKDWNKAILQPVTLEKIHYGGARVDRLAARNQFTNQIGLPECSGMYMYSLDNKNGYGGTFFADTVKGYGRLGNGILVDDNEMLVLVDNQDLPSPHAEYSYLNPQINTKADSYQKICKILNNRLADFDSYRNSTNIV